MDGSTSSGTDGTTDGGTDAGTDGGSDAGPGPQDAGVRIETPADACAPFDALPPGVQVLNGGAIIGKTGVSEPVTFTLPSDVQSFTVVLSAGPEVTLLLARMEDPNRRVLVSDDGALGLTQLGSTNRSVAATGVVSTMFPNNPSYALVGGEYSMVVAAFFDGRPFEDHVGVQIYYKNTTGTTGCVDLNLYFTGAGNLNAKNASRSPLLKNALSRFERIYGQAGIEFGHISYHDIDSSFRTRTFSSQNETDDGDFGEMFEFAKDGGPGLHIFFIDRIEGAMGGVIGGVAGGIPGSPKPRGPANPPGSVAGGVAISLVAAQDDPETLALIMGHESGHWLGLFHTVESDERTQDQIPDTPEGQSGIDHLMYPFLTGGDQISTQQGRILRNNIEVVNP